MIEFSCFSPVPQTEAKSLSEELQQIVNRVSHLLQVDSCILRPFEIDHLFSHSLIYQKSRDIFSNLAPISIELLESTVWQTRHLETIHCLDNLNPLKFQTIADYHKQREIYQRAAIGAALLVPLKRQETLIAELAFYYWDNPHYWTETEIELTLLVGEQIALAIAQARDYERIRDLAQREVLINNITTAIRSSLDLTAIFRAVTRQLGQALGVDGCALSLWTVRDEFVQCVGLYDCYESEILVLPQSVVPIAQNPVLQKLLHSFEPVAFEDRDNYPEMNQFDLPLRKPAKALLIVPLILEGGIIGSISLRQTENSRLWLQSEIELVQAVASQAAIAVQQARLYETTKQQAQQLLISEQKVKQLNQYLTESVLKRFLPAEIVNQVATGELVLDLSPEPRLVTVLFSDLVGFTPLASHLGTQRVAILLNEYLETMTQAIFDHGGTVDKFIGDGIVALFGAPATLSPKEQVKRAIAVARSMHYALDCLNQRWQVQGLVGDTSVSWVRFRCGIHQGKAVVGMFGGGQRSDYTAIGLAVNLAARLQEAAEANTILVSQSVVNYLDQAEILSVQPLHLKGIEEVIQAFSVKIKVPLLLE